MRFIALYIPVFLWKPYPYYIGTTVLLQTNVWPPSYVESSFWIYPRRFLHKPLLITCEKSSRGRFAQFHKETFIALHHTYCVKQIAFSLASIPRNISCASFIELFDLIRISVWCLKKRAVSLYKSDRCRWHRFKADFQLSGRTLAYALFLRSHRYQKIIPIAPLRAEKKKVD